ncbi:hypothetical protein C815_01161 [Firmicutes bacterium M10-2]|nr:hypothetical protein C815_01161 [Firmicutes bacterium M10-2]
MRVQTDRQFPSSTGKRLRTNAFTFAEMLIVLLIVALLSTLSMPKYDPLSLFMEQLKEKCVQAQLQAYADKEDIEVRIMEHEVWINDETIPVPHPIACTPLAFSYNANGNITKGGTSQCRSDRQTMKIVFQLGMGRVSVR